MWVPSAISAFCTAFYLENGLSVDVVCKSMACNGSRCEPSTTRPAFRGKVANSTPSMRFVSQPRFIYGKRYVNTRGESCLREG
ncbi:hypothetical protein EDB84DRAFT_771561 [Lactarius hengduanensis]|nr:hypothetical protein EDB84DRAFT_771561 [Lactarius hengduanensis]